MFAVCYAVKTGICVQYEFTWYPCSEIKLAFAVLGV